LRNDRFVPATPTGVVGQTLELIVVHDVIPVPGVELRVWLETGKL